MSGKLQNKVDELVNQIRNGIQTGRYPAGTMFYQEALAEEYKVSRTPVREALMKLAYEGYLEVGKKRQFKVPQIDWDQLVQYYRLREVIDGLGARLLAEEVVKGEDKTLRVIEELESTLIRMEDVINSWNLQKWSKENVKFHTLIIEGTKNTPLINQLSVVQVSANIFYPAVMANPSRAKIALDEHRLILNAIRKGEADLAENIARFHIRSALKDSIEQRN